jgi:hypothetical protein
MSIQNLKHSPLQTKFVKMAIPPAQRSTHKQTLIKLVERFLGKQLLSELKDYANPEKQIDIALEPIENPAQRLAVGAMGLACICVGAPTAAVLPVLPVTPFVVVGLMCMARSSSRFRTWLSRQQPYRVAVTVIHTRNELPFRLARACFTLLAGNPSTHAT